MAFSQTVSTAQVQNRATVASPRVKSPIQRMGLIPHTEKVARAIAFDVAKARNKQIFDVEELFASQLTDLRNVGGFHLAPWQVWEELKGSWEEAVRVSPQDLEIDAKNGTPRTIVCGNSFCAGTGLALKGSSTCTECRKIVRANQKRAKKVESFEVVRSSEVQYTTPASEIRNRRYLNRAVKAQFSRRH